MNHNWLDQFDLAVRNSLPGFALVCLVLASAIPLPVLSLPTPDLVLVGVYVVAARRGDLFPLWLAFAIGVFQDLVGSTPLGMHALIYVLVHGLASTQQRFLATFSLFWGCFALVAAFAATVSWLTVAAYYGAWLSMEPVAGQAVASIVLFPPVAVTMISVGRLLR